MEILLVLIFAIVCIFLTLSIAETNKKPVQNFFIRIEGPVHTNIDVDFSDKKELSDHTSPRVIDAVYTEKVEDPRIRKAIRAYTSCLDPQEKSKWSEVR